MCVQFFFQTDSTYLVSLSINATKNHYENLQGTNLVAMSMQYVPVTYHCRNVNQPGKEFWKPVSQFVSTKFLYLINKKTGLFLH